MNIYSRKNPLHLPPDTSLEKEQHQRITDAEKVITGTTCGKYVVNNNKLGTVPEEKKVDKSSDNNTYCLDELPDLINHHSSGFLAHKGAGNARTSTGIRQAHNYFGNGDLLETEADTTDSTSEWDENEENANKGDSEYNPSVLRALLRVEKRQRPRSSSIIASQTYLNYKSREKLILWMINVHQKYCSYQQTMHLAASILDRFCTVWIFRHHYQLYGVVSLWIAAKYQEKSSCPVLSQWVHTTVANRFSASAINLTEELILKSINFVVGVTTCVEFYHLLSAQKNFGRSKKIIVDRIAEYLMDLTLITEENIFYSKLPSEVATICLYLAEKIASEFCINPAASPALTDNSSIETSGINIIDKPTLLLLCQAVNPPEVIAKKYSKSEIGDPSVITALWLKSQHKILFAMDLLLCNLNKPPPDPPQKQTPDTAPLSPPKTPYMVRIPVPPSTHRKLPGETSACMGR